MGLLGEVRAAVRSRHYSRRTERAYVGWVRRFALFVGGDPRHGDRGDVDRFLTHLAADVSAATQNQARSALVFLYAQVLDRPLAPPVRARAPVRMPVVLTRAEAVAVLAGLTSGIRVVALLLYGAGLRLSEALTLRVKDVDFLRKEIRVRCGKGGRDRITVLPEIGVDPLRRQLMRVQRVRARDEHAGIAIPLPDALDRTVPRAGQEWAWMWVFPARRVIGRLRWHLHSSAVQRAVRAAAEQAQLSTRVTTHAFRHSFATDLLASGYDIRTVQELLGHRDVRTTMRYTHVLNRGGLGVQSPADHPDLKRALTSAFLRP